jgi:TnpA family transposase
MADKSPQLLNEGQRLLFTTIPQELTAQELEQQYKLTDEDKRFIQRFHGETNRLGVALQLCTLRYPGRSLLMMTVIPLQLVAYVAEQISVAPQAYNSYGQPRRKTPYDHLESIRQQYGYRAYETADDTILYNHLRPTALESDEPIPLVEAACLWMRTYKVIPPPLPSTERVVWELLRETRATVYRELSNVLSADLKQTLNKMLEPEESKGKVTPVAWLHQPAKHPSSNSMYHLIERITYLDALDLPERPIAIHPNRFRQLAQRGEQYRSRPLANLVDENERMALLFTQLVVRRQTLVDQLLDMFDRWMLDLTRKGRRRQRHHLYRNITTLNRDLNTLTTAVAAFLAAKTEGKDPFEAVFAVVDEARLTKTIESAAKTSRPDDMDYRDLVEHIYLRRRKAMLMMFRTLPFQAVAEKHAALEALDFVLLLLDEEQLRVREIEQTIDGKTMQVPVEHLKRKRWKRHALTEDGVNPNYYELAAFDRLREALRAGDIMVDGSLRYLDFDSYLLPEAQWQLLQQTATTQLAVPDDAQTYLQDSQTQFEAAAKRLKEALKADESPLTVSDDGDLHLARLKQSVPTEVDALRYRLYNHMPTIDFTQMVIDVDQWTGFLDQFTHLVSGTTPTRKGKGLLSAALLENGMNIGASRMALATDFSVDELAQVAEWRIREETVRGALSTLDNFVLHHPYSQHWGQGTTSSSDGMRIPVVVKSPHAVYNAKYFWYRRGITLVTHAADIWMPFFPQVIEDTREALYIIDALLHHQTDLNLTEHHTDTAGATYHVFALCRLLGIQFTPRIRDITQKYLYAVEETNVDKALKPLFKGVIDSQLLASEWDRARHFGASIRHGTAPASVLMRKLAAYPQHSSLAGALREMGKLERSLFILNYMPDAVMQRRSLTALNKGEAIQGLARTIHIGQSGELREPALDAQVKRTSGLMLLTAVVSAWNTVYLDQVVKTLRANGETISDDYLQHISPLGWRHINFLGHYHFDLNQVYPLSNLRPLK